MTADDSTKINDIKVPLAIIQGDIIMAEIDTAMLSQQHGDIRREAAEHRATIQLENMKGFDRVNADVLRTASDNRQENTRNFADGRYAGATQTSEIIKEGLKESFNLRGDVKDTRHDLAKDIDRTGDRIVDQNTAYYISNSQNATQAARDLATLSALTEANATSMRAEIQLNVEKSSAAAALAGEKIATAVALGQSQLSKELFQDGQRTRDLINDLKYHDLNRSLVERNAELVDERHGRRHYSRVADQNQFQGQWAALQSQIQAFQSQLQTATQGTVNFGTMSGNAGRNSSTNNVA